MARRIENTVKDFMAQITGVNVYPVKSKKADWLKAMISIEFNDMYTVSGFRLCEGKNGAFVAFPSTYDGKESHPNMWLINFEKEEKQKVSEELLKLVEKEMK